MSRWQPRAEPGGLDGHVARGELSLMAVEEFEILLEREDVFGAIVAGQGGDTSLFRPGRVLTWRALTSPGGDVRGRPGTAEPCGYVDEFGASRGPRLGTDRSHARRYVMKLGYSFHRRRTADSRRGVWSLTDKSRGLLTLRSSRISKNGRARSHYR